MLQKREDLSIQSTDREQLLVVPRVKKKAPDLVKVRKDNFNYRKRIIDMTLSHLDDSMKDKC
jgi:hypothetical protein